jgi:ribonuclease D
LIKILQNTQIKKIFHNAVFDVSFLLKNLKIDNVDNIICTRISSKLVNGLEHKNSLKPLLKEYLDIDITKEFQTSDWTAKTLTQGQLDYAMSDVIYLRSLWDKLEIELSEQNLLSLAHRIFNFIPTYVLLQMKNIDNIFIY